MWENAQKTAVPFNSNRILESDTCEYSTLNADAGTYHPEAPLAEFLHQAKPMSWEL
jgi:hypothetical protein